MIDFSDELLSPTMPSCLRRTPSNRSKKVKFADENLLLSPNPAILIPQGYFKRKILGNPTTADSKHQNPTAPANYHQYSNFHSRLQQLRKEHPLSDNNEEQEEEHHPLNDNDMHKKLTTQNNNTKNRTHKNDDSAYKTNLRTSGAPEFARNMKTEKHRTGSSQQNGGKIAEINCDAFTEMSRHCEDCLRQLQSSFDKALQAYQMVTRRDDPELAPEEREQLESGLISGFEHMHRRLGQVISLGERVEPEGGLDPKIGSGAGSPQGVRQITSTSPGTNLNTSNSNANIESMLQQYSKTILNMVQEQLNQSK